MGTIYAIANQKGGVGKTTTAVNVAACIAAAGYETLVVDVDPAGQRDRRAGRLARAPGVYDVLSGTFPPATPSGRPTSSASRSSSPRRISPARRWSCRAWPAPRRRLREALDPLREDYAFILLDCPPSLGPLTVNALVAAERVIVPGPDRVLRARRASPACSTRCR